MRLLKPPERPLNFPDLGINPKDEKLIRDALKATQGMVIVCGPTGCGKTTTIYACMGELNKPNVNIMTIEDPIEYSIPRVNQIQVNPKAGITFASGLRSIVRQDPDIIMVGEIRDKETAEIAVNAALTGHLVLSTLHTNNASGAITRLMDMGIEPFFLEPTLKVIIGQRLVRKNCLNCVESYEISPSLKKLIEAQLALYGIEMQVPKVLYKGKGCKVCGYSGYRGRTGIFEVLNVSKNIRELILKRAPSSLIEREAIKEGMTLMIQDGLKKVESGITTIEEVLRVVRI
jgi:type IV pilus assembly protein PilB